MDRFTCAIKAEVDSEALRLISVERLEDTEASVINGAEAVMPVNRSGDNVASCTRAVALSMEVRRSAFPKFETDIVDANASISVSRFNDRDGSETNAAAIRISVRISGDREASCSRIAALLMEVRRSA